MATPSDDAAQVARYADLLAAMGTEPRLRIIRLLLQAHPDSVSAGDIGTFLDIAPSTLSHHLDRLKREEVITVQRQGTHLRYMANSQILQELLQFLFAECCTRSSAVSPARLTFFKGNSHV